MSEEQGRFIGIGVAHMDYVFQVNEEYPTSQDEILSFIDVHNPIVVRAGGPMPNTFTAISYFLANRDMRLFHCVGDDDRGRLFQQETIPEIGSAQIHSTEPTGAWAGFVDDSGLLKYGVSYYGASLKIDIPETELKEQKIGVFITDISSCKNENIYNQTDRCLKKLNQDGGVFVFSLGGSRPSSVDSDRVSSVLKALRYDPQIVFSNAGEFKYATGSNDVKASLFDYFPNTRLLVITCGAEGSIIRFENDMIEIPVTTTIPIDDMGAGDAYAGTMLGQLFNHPYKLWNRALIENAGNAASFAASQIVTSPYVRLKPEQAKAVLEHSIYG